MCQPDAGRVGVKERVAPVVVVPRTPEVPRGAGASARIDTLLDGMNLAVAGVVDADGKSKARPVKALKAPPAELAIALQVEAAPKPQRKEVIKAETVAPAPAKSPSVAKTPAATPSTVQLATKLRVTLQEALAEAKRMSRESDRSKKFASRDVSVRKLCADLGIQFTEEDLRNRDARENLWRRVKQEVVKALGETSADRLLPNFIKFSDRD